MNARLGASCAALVLSASLWAQGAAPAAPVPDYSAARAVLRSRGVLDQRDAQQLVQGLAALGADAVPALYELATGRGLDGLIGEEWIPAEWRCEPEGIPPLAQQALERAPRAAVLAHLEGVLDAEPRDTEILLVLRLLAAQRSSGGLALVLRCAEQLGDMEVLRPSVRTALRTAFTEILRADRKAWAAIEARVASMNPAVCGVLVEAVGASARAEGMRVLTRLFGRAEPPQERVAEAMAQLELARPWELGGQTLERCKGWWRANDAALRACVATLAGRLGAAESAPALIALLADGDALVKRCAQHALEALAGGGSLPADEVGWQAWLEREQAWREARWPALLEDLTGRQPGPANEALRELTRHPLHRLEVAHALAGGLGEMPRTVALSACTELERIGSRQALPGLVAALEHGSPPLRAAALRALRALTGEDRELSLPLWHELIGT